MTIEVLEDIEDMCCPGSTLVLYSLVNTHVHLELNVGPIKLQDKFHLACTHLLMIERTIIILMVNQATTGDNVSKKFEAYFCFPP